MKYSQEYWEDVQQCASNIPNIERIFRKRVLITGATGMVCSAVVDVIVWLNQKYDAGIRLVLAGRSRERIVERFYGVLEDSDYEYIAYDATKAQIMDTKTDYIIHGASNANPAVFSKEPVETLVGNIVGLQNVLEVARKNEGSRLLYISSSEVYGNRTDKLNSPYREEDYGYVDFLNPRACYPNGKRTAETLCICYDKEFGVDSVIVRLGHIYGPTITKADSRASAVFTRNVLDGHNIIMKSEGTQLRSYCFMLDCASGILTVLLNGKRSNAYNISNKNSIVSIRTMAETLAKAANVDIIFENPSNVEKNSYNMMSNSVLDAKKLEDLGWRAAFPLDKGIQLTIKYGGE